MKYFLEAELRACRHWKAILETHRLAAIFQAAPQPVQLQATLLDDGDVTTTRPRLNMAIAPSQIHAESCDHRLHGAKGLSRAIQPLVLRIRNLQSQEVEASCLLLKV